VAHASLVVALHRQWDTEGHTEQTLCLFTHHREHRHWTAIIQIIEQSHSGAPISRLNQESPLGLNRLVQGDWTRQEARKQGKRVLLPHEVSLLAT